MNMSTTNYSYYAIPLIFAQPLYASLRGPFNRLKVDDNVNPRLVLDRLEKEGKHSPRLIASLRRRESCEKNLWEGLSMIFAAIVAGNTAGLSAKWMNGVSAAYFLFRCAYIYAYLNITDKKTSFIRSGLWWASNFCSLITFVKAVNALNRKLL